MILKANKISKSYGNKQILYDIDLEINRLSKRIDKLKKHILVSEKKLSNKNFVANAPENIINHEKEKMVQLKLEKELLKKNLKMISWSTFFPY